MPESSKSLEGERRARVETPNSDSSPKELNTGRQATLVSAPTNRGGIRSSTAPPHTHTLTLNSTPIPAHSRHPTSRRRPDSKLFYKPPLFRENEEERLRGSPSHPLPARKSSFVDSAVPRALPCSPRRGRGKLPTQEEHPAPLAHAPPPGTSPGPPAAASTWPQVFARLLRRPQPAPPRPAPSPALHHGCLAPSPRPRGQQRRSPRGCQEGEPLSASGRNDQVSPPAAREPSAALP